MEYKRALQATGLSPVQLALRYGLPAIVGAIILITLIQFTIHSTWLSAGLSVVIALAALGWPILWPLVQAEGRRTQIDHALPLFMTHFGVLATSDLGTTDILALLAKKKEYRALTRELERIRRLVSDWHQSLPDAARVVSESTPSSIFRDFLERLANALESGQDIGEFLKAEQAVIMKEYETVYQGSLYQIESWKEIYMSAIMSGAFGAIFAILMPILIGGDPVILLTMILGGLAAMLGLLYLLLRMRLPPDRLMPRAKADVPERDRVRISLMAAVAVSAVMIIIIPLLALPLEVKIALIVTPLIIPGIVSQLLEARIRRRERNFSAFIRSLGSSIEARGGSLEQSLGRLRNQNLGPLEDLVVRLHNRLGWRVDEERAWHRFAEESGSHLVASFTHMFVEGMRAGGRAGDTSHIISNNVLAVLNMRASRITSAQGYRNLLYGLTAGIAFVLFIGAGILTGLSGLFDQAQSITSVESPIEINLEINETAVQTVLLLMILLHAGFAAIYYKMADGGVPTSALLLFVVLTWIGLGVSAFTNRIAPGIVGTG